MLLSDREIAYYSGKWIFGERRSCGVIYESVYVTIVVHTLDMPAHNCIYVYMYINAEYGLKCN